MTVGRWSRQHEQRPPTTVHLVKLTTMNSALALLVIVTSACTSSESSTPSTAPPVRPARVQDPNSPVLSVRAAPPAGREVAFVQVWNWDGAESPRRPDGAAVVVPFEVTDSAGNEVGFFSSCFPAELCTPEQYVNEGACVTLPNGGDDCLIVSGSGTRHIIHVMQGPVTTAEALAGAQIAEEALD